MAQDTATNESNGIELTLTLESKPEFDFVFDGDPNNPDDVERAIENAEWEASISLSEMAHEYEWEARRVEGRD